MVVEMKSSEKKRILHIGNIANNAYQNAKILNEYGYENIVVSYDYYHIMGCPEWDDAVIDGTIKNQNFPQWHKVNLNGFNRPDWFVAAPLKLCVEYIEAYCKGDKLRAFFLKKKERKVREKISDVECDGKSINNKDIIEKVYFIIRWCVLGVAHVIRKIVRCLTRVVKYFVLKFVGIMCRFFHELIGIYCRLLRKYDGNKVMNFIYTFSKKTFDKLVKENKKNINKNNNDIREQVENDFKELFPDRTCIFGDSLDNYIQVAKIMKPILGYFNEIIGYATNPVFLYLSGCKDYIAYEHGTLRDLPYEDSDMGRLMLIAYAKSKAIYCTNVDCYESAQYITQKTKIPIICGLHGIDIDALIGKIDEAKNWKESNLNWITQLSGPVFFCPARHSWDPSRNCYIKGENKFIEAATRISGQGYDFTIIMVEWGDNTEDIRKMIDNASNLCKHIKWIQPLSKKELYYLYNQSDAVLDQFILKAYGAITFEVLASGRPVLISAGADEKLEKAFFGDNVLHYSCYEADEIYDAMMEVINKTDRYRWYSQNGRSWIKEHHSKECIYNALMRAIEA